jgi:hypothetical protein
MTPARDIRDDLEPDATEELIQLAERLERERPVPAAAFRGTLRRMLLHGEPARSRPAQLRLLITGYVSAGAALLVVAALSVAGVGPLGT